MYILLIMMFGVSYCHNPAMYQSADTYHEEFETNPGDDLLRIGPLQCTYLLTFNLTACYGGEIIMARDWALSDGVARVNIGEYRAGKFWTDITTDTSGASFKGNPLQCGVSMSFWVSLSNGLVRIGHSLTMGYSNFMYVTGSTDFHHFGFRSQNQSDWAIDIHSTCAS